MEHAHQAINTALRERAPTPWERAAGEPDCVGCRHRSPRAHNVAARPQRRRAHNVAALPLAALMAQA
ncbi:hypothetical protein ACH492_25860 [Streptomyces sp. NPDC019443]|uniref:hypothetical protein n=1 Tax=Streptomyces sp. NPDC019443 TaxID=3365061 RepID=UPI003796AB13